jgi:hypothetical protein
MKIMRGGATALLISFGTAGAVFAQDQPQGTTPGNRGQEFRAACAADVQTYCASAKGREDRHQCMQTNRDKFSDGCKSFLDSHGHGHGG